jgi:hypothetical protein
MKAARFTIHKEEKMRTKSVVIGVAIGVLLSTMVVLAGNLEPDNPPATTSSYTLEDIYQRLSAGTAGTRSTFTEPPGPWSTMHTLDEIMAVAPAVDDTNGAVPADVLSGKTYWGLRTGGTWGMQTGTATYLPAPVPKTGQSGCTKTTTGWSSCTCGTADCPFGQDGHLKEGVAWPNPRFTVHTNGTSLLTDDTVTDNLTGLMWTRNANHGQLKWDAAGGSPAIDYCSNLVLGGYDDWRLPNVRELQSLVHYGFERPPVPNTAGTGKCATDGDPFIDIQWERYWTSTLARQPYILNAWYVNMDHGIVSHFDFAASYYVWPVRGGQ